MPYAFGWLTMLVRLPTFVLVTLGLGLVAACGSKTFDSVESGGAAGKGGSDGGGDGGSGASNPKGGSAGSTSGSGGSGGSAGQGVGGTGRGGTSNGGTGAGGTDVGGASGTGGSTGGAGARAGSGGASAGSGGSAAGAGGSAAGAGGSAAGAGGSAAGAGGCSGVCPRVACLPPVMVTVTAAGGITELQGQLENDTTGTTLGDLQCYAGGGTPCTWTCQFYQSQISNGDYTIVLSAPGYESKSIDFTVVQATNCGCCGCGCGIGYQGTTTLEPDGSGTPECCSALTDATNCGACGHACESGQACSNGSCVSP